MPSEMNNLSKVYISNLSDDVSLADLQAICRTYGTIRNIWIAPNPPRYALVEYETAKDAADLVRDMHGMPLCGRSLHVELFLAKVDSRKRKISSSSSDGHGFEYQSRRSRSFIPRRRSSSRRSFEFNTSGNRDGGEPSRRRGKGETTPDRRVEHYRKNCSPTTPETHYRSERRPTGHRDRSEHPSNYSRRKVSEPGYRYSTGDSSTFKDPSRNYDRRSSPSQYCQRGSPGRFSNCVSRDGAEPSYDRDTYEPPSKLEHPNYIEQRRSDERGYGNQATSKYRDNRSWDRSPVSQKGFSGRRDTSSYDRPLKRRMGIQEANKRSRSSNGNGRSNQSSSLASGSKNQGITPDDGDWDEGEINIRPAILTHPGTTPVDGNWDCDGVTNKTATRGVSIRSDDRDCNVGDKKVESKNVRGVTPDDGDWDQPPTKTSRKHWDSQQRSPSSNTYEPPSKLKRCNYMNRGVDSKYGGATCGSNNRDEHTAFPAYSRSGRSSGSRGACTYDRFESRGRYTGDRGANTYGRSEDRGKYSGGREAKTYGRSEDRGRYSGGRATNTYGRSEDRGRYSGGRQVSAYGRSEDRGRYSGGREASTYGRRFTADLERDKERYNNYGNRGVNKARSPSAKNHGVTPDDGDWDAEEPKVTSTSFTQQVDTSQRGRTPDGADWDRDEMTAPRKSTLTSTDDNWDNDFEKTNKNCGRGVTPDDGDWDCQNGKGQRASPLRECCSTTDTMVPNDREWEKSSPVTYTESRERGTTPDDGDWDTDLKEIKDSRRNGGGIDYLKDDTLKTKERDEEENDDWNCGTATSSNLAGVTPEDGDWD